MEIRAIHCDNINEQEISIINLNIASTDMQLHGHLAHPLPEERQEHARSVS
jgi:hypothetical protein